uniref:Uncharacterized protein n=1 Tax=Legionella jamestowniensis TaxID=455 RepID=C6ZD44_9GAMM|nr:hypothetical protein [Legionella jamestowniensis]
MNQAMRDFIYFQNMVPGKQESPFIQQFKQACLDSEPDEDVKQYRQQLLGNFPPILTFKNKKQEEDFYKQEAMNCSNFCCGEVVPEQSNPSVKDNYKLSIGNGELYEGNADSVKSQLKEDINSETFGSPQQEQYLNGLKEFSTKVSERESPSLLTKQSEDLDQSKDATSTPFKTTPKPWKD